MSSNPLLVPTPISLVESYFKVKLTRSSLKHFKSVEEEVWINFAKFYKKSMKENFGTAFLERGPDCDSETRLYFEPMLRDEWDKAIKCRYRPTPLIGVSPHPNEGEKVTRERVSDWLNPLKKHLLIAHSVYIRDNFYYCMDFVADTVNPDDWRDNPNTVNLVNRSIQSIKNWLPILIELGPLIRSKALVFMPYYITPSFPYGGQAPALKSEYAKLTHTNPVGAPVSCYPDHVVGAWLNSLLLNLDPVFPDNASLNFAAGLGFKGDHEPTYLNGNPVTFEIKAFREPEDINLNDLESMRKNEEIFHEIRSMASECKKAVETSLRENAPPSDIRIFCEGTLRDRLDAYERKSVVRIIKDNLAASTAVTLAVGTALVPVGLAFGGLAGAAVGVIGSAALSPDILHAVQKRWNPKRRAYGHLHSML